MIPIGTLCYVVGLTDETCALPHGASLNGRVVEIAGPLAHAPEMIGDQAYPVRACWLDDGEHLCAPACLLPIAGPGRDPERTPVTVDAGTPSR